jgi:hypothetical protein
MRWTAWATTAALSIVLGVARDVSAQPTPETAADPADPAVFYPSPRVHVFAGLTFVREPNASICPDEQWLRDLLGGPMGIDVFAPNPRGVSVGHVRVVMSRTPGGFAAAYVWEDARGTTRSKRYVHRGSTFFHCREAMWDLTTDLSIEFSLIELELGDQYAHLRSNPHCPAAPAAPTPGTPVGPCPPATRFDAWPERPPPPLRAPTPDPPKPPERWPIAVRLGVAAGPELIATGWGSLGFAASLGTRYRALSLDVEAHGNPSLGAQNVTAADAVGFSRVVGAAVLCGSWGWFTGCGIGEAGRLAFSPRLAFMPDTALYAAAGVRAGFDFPVLPPRLFLHTAVDVLAPINPASYVSSKSTVFQAAGPAVGLGLGLLFELSP